MKTDIAIIGGGAAGLFAAAIAAGEYNKRGEAPSVLLLEKMERCGRKIALTGKGRCNLTNTKPWEEFARHIHPKNIFLKNAFYAMSNLKTMEFFERMGLPLTVERGDRVFPESMRAMDVTRVMADYVKNAGIQIRTGTEVTGVSYLSAEEGFRISINGGSGEVTARKVILATGGLSYPSTGSTGDGYGFARALGHTVTPCFPSLTALIPANYREDLHGISLKNVSVKLLVNKNIVADEFGDLDFTSGGIEGPIGFKVSRTGVWSLINGQKVELVLDMKPAVTKEQLVARIRRELEALPVHGRRIDLLLPKLLPKALIRPFLSSHKEITTGNLADALKGWKFSVTSYVGYERCVITAGGVSLAEVSQKTLESKRVPGLYFAGELLDLDGDTGGYNLQIAFSTAALASTGAVAALR